MTITVIHPHWPLLDARQRHKVLNPSDVFFENMANKHDDRVYSLLIFTMAGEEFVSERAYAQIETRVIGDQENLRRYVIAQHERTVSRLICDRLGLT